MSRSEIIATFYDRIQQGIRRRLSKEDLDGLIAGFIELLQGADSEAQIKTLCDAEIRLLEQGYPQTTLATKYFSIYRKAIEAAIADGTLKQTASNSHRYVHRQRKTGRQEDRIEHWALTHLKYAPEVYEALDKRQSTINRNKQLSLKLVQVDRYLQTLERLVTEPGPFAARRLAIAIAGFTGRRIGEVVARGSFCLTDHPYMLHFEGQQKKEREGYNIITLIPAATVLEQIQRFRQLPEIQKFGEMTGETLRGAINQFDVQANRVCDRLLGQSGVVPPLEGKKSVTVHNLRSLWGAVAAYFFCPEHHHEYAFLQHYLGHVLDSGATGNYFRYQLTDDRGRLLREKGVLLAQVGALPLMEEEMEAEHEEAEQDRTTTPLLDLLKASEPMRQVQPDRRKSTTPRRASAAAVSPAELDVAKLQQAWQGALAQTAATLRSEFEAQLQAVRLETNGGWFVRRVEGLERENLSLRRERDRAIAQAEGSQGYGEKIAQLQAENAILAQKLKLAQDKLDGFRLLLNGTETIDTSETTETEAASSPSEQPTQSAEQPDSAITPTVEKRTEPRMSAPPSDPQPTTTLANVRGPKAGRAFKRAEAIFLVIKEWNRLYPSESFAVNAGVLETVFRVHRQAVKEFCQAYQNELWDYHQEIGVESPRWHNRGKDTEKLKAFVTQRMQG
jgi:integrase